MKNVVLTLTGHDRVGLVEQVTKIVLDQNGNVEASRMAHLGGEFAMLMHITVAPNRIQDLHTHLKSLKQDGYHITICETRQEDPGKYSGWLPFRVEVSGADHEGIIHEMARHMAECGINIENMDTSTVIAPVSCTPLFTMQAIVMAPPDLPAHQWQERLKVLGNTLNVETEISPYKG